MTTYALPIPERLAAQLAALPAERVEQVNAELTEYLQDILEDRDTFAEMPPLTEDDQEAIGRGLAEADAGKTKNSALFLSELRTRYGIR